MSSARHIRFSALLLLVCLGSGLRSATAGEDEARNLEPIPRSVVFADPGGQNPPLDGETDRAIRDEIQRSFAALGGVVEARELLVQRYGLVSVPALRDVLLENKNDTEVWNAALTVGALRDREGSAFELLPALKPLVKVLGDTGPAHRKAMAALALGCFHYHQEDLPARYRGGQGRAGPLPGIDTAYRRSAEALREGRRLLATNLAHQTFFFRIAVTFAMAKMGGDNVAEEFFRVDAPAANPEPRRARILASAFLGAPDPRLYRKHLLGVEAKAAQRTEEASAALAMAVAMLQEDAPDWTREADSILKHLRGIGAAQSEAQKERIFGIGVCAHVNQANEAWKEVWDAALLSSANEGVVGAAAQVLVHCPLPAIERKMIDLLVNPSKTPQRPVLAMAMLRAAASGHADALPKLGEWLRNKAKRPAADPRWDPRWYAVVGLLRALHEGRIKSKAERAQVVDVLRRAAGPTSGKAGTLDRGASIREPLRAILEVHAERLMRAEPSALYLLPQAAVDRVEASFACPYGLLEGDIIDACVARVNRMVMDIFRLRNVPAWKPGADNSKFQPERYLKRYLQKYPYFSRLEFRSERGRRPEPALATGDVGIDR